MTPDRSSEKVVAMLEMSRSRVFAEYHQFHVRPPDELPEHPAMSNGLADVGPGGVTIWTGVSIGYVDVLVERCETGPPVDLEGWEEAVEVSIAVPGGELWLADMMADATDDRPPLTSAPGDYRLRVQARGRDTAIDLSSGPGEPFEHYLLQIWPATIGPEASLLQTDLFGRQQRQAFA